MCRDDINELHVSMHEDERKILVEALTRTKIRDASGLAREPTTRSFFRRLVSLTKILVESPATAEELQDDRQPVVISVSGNSGVGKTTLVRSVYKEMEKNNHFDIQAIQSFGPYLTATNILHQIVQQLTDDNQNCPRSKVKQMLRNKLENKKYLLVIDGEVTSTEWKNILTILSECNAGADKGNRIVHITQHEPQEPSGPHHVIIKLKNLEEIVTKELFLMRLKNGKEVRDEDYKRHHQAICRISNGLPLAVVLLSGLLQTKEPHDWEEVFKYFESKKRIGVISILTLCFDDLPHMLKSCFLYFAALPTNTSIEAHNLVCMWMAEGFLRPMVGVTLEKVGNIYLNELIRRNLVNPVQQEDYSNPGSKLVSVQNIVHDFLQSEAHAESFLEVHRGDDIPTLTSARRLSLQNYTDKYAALANPLPKLRSVFSQFEQDPKDEEEKVPILRKWAATPTAKKKQSATSSIKKEDIRTHIEDLLHGSEFLRVINLQGIEIGNKLPDAIHRVAHLQYLGITSCSLTKIPPSIGSLTNLQTLDVRETGVRDLPPVFWKIKTLRHVFCFALKLPKQMDSLKHIQTLNSIELDDYEQALHHTLGKMIHLENLFVWNTKEHNVKSLSRALSMLEYLRTLALHGYKIPSSVFTITSLRRVKYMVLEGALELPSELHAINSCLPNLIWLSLKETKVPQGFITDLADLPSLATLALYSGSYRDRQLSFSRGGFRRLKSIKLDIEHLATLQVENGALENLRELDILSEKYRPKIEAEERIQKIIV
ncbi:hypothetical protein BS78_08G092500 [Paspalum vaginatum]|nr:hypothetical protein BS78_08G092500 [Paspalum vaginatum]